MKSFIDTLYSIREDEFELRAMELFKYQARNNRIYKDYLESINHNPEMTDKLDRVPFLPISFFKNHTIKTGKWSHEKVFKSSGTTGERTSQHFIRSESFYHKNCLASFRKFYGDPSDYVFLAVLPSYLENEHSSLISMIDFLIRRSEHNLSDYYLADRDLLTKTIGELKGNTRRRVILWGVTYALLDLADRYDADFSEMIVIETGGMKGRREELIRQEVHNILMEKFNLGNIHSEYGMTELMSQAYSKDSGKFRTPSWMKVFTREINDPFAIDNSLNQGVLQIVDLANYDTCAFIDTEDIGKINSDGTFEVLGRLDNSDVRGCNLLVDQN